jgi:hypothetical protein
VTGEAARLSIAHAGAARGGVVPGRVLNSVLTSLGPWIARLAVVAVLAQVENPYWTAACLAVFAAQIPIQRAILARDKRLQPAYAAHTR